MKREEIHRLPWKVQEYINDLQRKISKNDVVSTFFCEDEDLKYSSKKYKKQCLGCNWIQNL